jgi:hypothetical protein
VRRSRPPDLAWCTFTAVLGKVVLPALVSPLLAGVVAFAATRAA